MTKLEQAARQLLEHWDSGLTIHDELDALREALANTRSSIRSTSEYSEQAERVTKGNGSEVSLETEAQEPFKMICPRCKVDRVTTQCPNRGGIGDCPMTATAQSAAPVSIQNESETDSSSSSMRTTVRTKDLTDDEIQAAIPWVFANEQEIRIARAVIAAYKEKNK